MNSWGVGEEVEYAPHPDHASPAVLDGVAAPIRGHVVEVKGNDLYRVTLNRSAGGDTVQLHGDQLRFPLAEPDWAGWRAVAPAPRPPIEVLTAMVELAYVQGHLEGMAVNDWTPETPLGNITEAIRDDIERMDAARTVVNKYLLGLP